MDYQKKLVIPISSNVVYSSMPTSLMLRLKSIQLPESARARPKCASDAKTAYEATSSSSLSIKKAPASPWATDQRTNKIQRPIAWRASQNLQNTTNCSLIEINGWTLMKQVLTHRRKSWGLTSSKRPSEGKPIRKMHCWKPLGQTSKK